METFDTGLQEMRIASRPCCGNDSNATPCDEPGNLACKKCLLITYCSKACQTSHWATHGKDCNSSYMEESWKPRWFFENRPPAFLISDEDPETIGPVKYLQGNLLWGNVPAIDVVQLGLNEGLDFAGPVNMLYAASGDMGNAIFSVTTLPSAYQGHINITINDRDLNIVARNAIMLLIFFVEDNPVVASECVVHVWYSTLITDACQQMLLSKVLPMIEDVCTKIAQKPGPTLLGKTWQFGTSSLRLVLTRDDWFALRRYLDIPRGTSNTEPLSKDDAQRLRQKVTCDPERIDHVDWALLSMSPSTRLATTKFREDGVLLPFAQSRGHYTCPNPTMFFSDIWPQMDKADPLAGWSMETLREFYVGPATNDLYGKLYFYLKVEFARFHSQIRSLPTSFVLLRVDAQDLPATLEGKHFDRIDVGNITDLSYLRTETTLRTFRPLLQPVSVNPHATLITLYLNAVAETRLLTETITPNQVRAGFLKEQMKKVLRYMPELGPQIVSSSSHPTFMKMVSAIKLILDMDWYFDSYMRGNRIVEAVLTSGTQMKSPHTIVKPWPWRMYDQRPTQQAKEDFALLLGSAQTGQERYVEWKLVPEFHGSQLAE
ncbi:hypothetical protein F4808DRAFT_472945 [Astrocystis sublimbata]|nr:hypothetical protein F4808DRAFT_472945 [Astrocystis sublimbata]